MLLITRFEFKPPRSINCKSQAVQRTDGLPIIALLKQWSFVFLLLSSLWVKKKNYTHTHTLKACMSYTCNRKNSLTRKSLSLSLPLCSSPLFACVPIARGRITSTHMSFRFDIPSGSSSKCSAEVQMTDCSSTLIHCSYTLYFFAPVVFYYPIVGSEWKIVSIEVFFVHTWRKSCSFSGISHIRASKKLFIWIK